MAQLLFGHDEVLARWAEDQYPEGAPLTRPLIAIGIANNAGTELWGVAIYSGMTPTNIDYSMINASPRWATRGTIRALLHYPFLQLGVKRMTALTLKSNKRARRVLTGMGFKQEGVHPYAFPNGKTAISYGLYHNVAMEKWLNEQRGQGRTESARSIRDSGGTDGKQRQYGIGASGA